MRRRDFLATGAGLVVAVTIPGCRPGDGDAAPAPGPFQPSAWIRIDGAGQVTLWVSKSEMGQGPLTALAMILAEELDADWREVRIEQAPADEAKYGDQTTGGSDSIRSLHDPLRRAGAAAREMLVAAASSIWQVDPKTCRAERGVVVHLPSRRRRTFGELAERASLQAVPADPPLKDGRELKLLGTPTRRVDAPAKIRGAAVFGMDVREPGMLVAAVARPVSVGAKAVSRDDTAALEVPGVRKVLPVGEGVAVLAEGTWAAFEGRRALRVTWEPGPDATLSTAGILESWAAAGKKPGVAGRSEGDPAAVLAKAGARKVESVYELPFLAHAPMEPMTCAAHVKKDSCEVWAPTQAPGGVVEAAMRITGLPREAVTVHVTFMGGGFGRRLEPDVEAEAIQLSRDAGFPVKVIWSREDDLRHDYYRPGSRHLLAGAVDASGYLSAWTHRVVAPSIGMPGARYGEGDMSALSGAAELPYAVPSIRVEHVMANTPIRLGYWRSVYHSQNAFANESFMDELARGSGWDPYEFRRIHLADRPRHLAVLDLAAEKSGWRRPPPPGRGRGIALHASFGSYVAQVAEVSVSASGEVRVHRVVCAIDCGRVVNPLGLEAQVEGAVVFGLSAALKGEITMERGAVRQSNFDTYDVLRMNEMPSVECHVVPSEEPPSGAGEPPVPPVAPALANAIRAATGIRLRRLPIRASDLRRAEYA